MMNRPLKIPKKYPGGLFLSKIISQSGLEMVPAGPHMPCNAGSNPVSATAGWTGVAPAEPHKLCNVGSNPIPATI